MRRTRVVAFDVDDTLYLERDYVRSGFLAVAAVVATEPLERERVFETLWRGFLLGQRGSSFNELLRAEPGLAKVWTPEQLVDVYRNHLPRINLLPGIEEVLDSLVSTGVRIGVITDGPAAAQRRKAQALRISGWADTVILTAELPGSPAKPQQDGYRAIMSSLWAVGEECLYVGDNPGKDFRGARELGWRTIRLRCSGQLHEAKEPEGLEDAPDEEVRSVEVLGRLLRECTRGMESQSE